VLLSSCEIGGEVCYLINEKIHVHQKVILFMGDGPSFIAFEKAAFEKSRGGRHQHASDILILPAKGTTLKE
jgi:hypothetical protein